MAKAQKLANKKPQKAPRYAGFWIRFLACILDLLIIGIPLLLLYLFFYFINWLNLYWLFNLAGVCLVIYLDGIYGGTPGKLILGLRIVNEKNEFIGIPNAILRYACEMISAIILGMGYLMIAWDIRKQGLHDRIAKTFVIYKD